MAFWHRLKKPIIVLAPLADVTDAAFRRLIAQYGKPDVMWTEFVSADGLMRADEEGRKKLLADLIYTEAERPIVAQLFGGNEENMEGAAALARSLGFDGIDINMGCPDRSVEKQGGGAAAIKNPEQARAIIRAAKRGAGDLPVSVKTRLGYNKDELETWLPELLKEEPALVTIHARTRKEMSKVPARWERVARAVEIRDEMGSKTLIFGNGDVLSVAHARELASEHHADGVMLGRAIFGSPWLFHPHKSLPERIAASTPSSLVHRNSAYGSRHDSALPSSSSPSEISSDGKVETISVGERLNVMVEHTRLFEELLPHKSFAIMKKHYKAYCHGFDGAKELRLKLMEASNAEEVAQIVTNFIEGLK